MIKHSNFRRAKRTQLALACLAVLATTTPRVFAATIGDPYYTGPIGPSSPVIFVPTSPTTTIPTSGSPILTTPGGLSGPSSTLNSSGNGPLGTTGSGPTGTHTTVVGPSGDATAGDAAAAGTSTLRRSLAAVQPHNELPKPSECVAQGEFEKTSAPEDPIWQRMVEAADKQTKARASTAKVQHLVGDRGTSRSADLGLGSPVRGPARDVFATPSHVVNLSDPDAVPASARSYFTGEPAALVPAAITPSRR